MSTTQTLTNGEKPSSQFINHLISYPLISDSLSTYQSNSLGAKSIDIFHSLYNTFATPVLPYLQTPYSIVHPYLAKADSLGDASLDKVDETFPAVKSTDFSSLKDTTYSIAGFPLKKAGEGKEYVFRTYGDEYNKTKGATGSDGLITTGRAIVSTELRIVAETLAAAWQYIGPKKDEAAKRFQGAKKLGQEKINELRGQTNEVIKDGKKKGEELKANGEAKAHEAKKEAHDAKKEFHGQVHQHK